MNIGRVALIAAALLAGAASQANASLISSYDFSGGLSDTLGNGVDLVASGGAVSGGRYSFSANQGLRLTSALPSTTDYAIEIKLQVNDSLDGFNKLMDFQDLASDFGLYEHNGAIEFFQAGPLTGSVSLNTDFTVGLARAGASISVFLDGSLLFTTLDGGQAVPGSNILNFFEDDAVTGGNESFAGSADWIRVHNDSSTFGTSPVVAIPVPAALPLFGAGLGIMGFLGWRRKRRSRPAL